MTQTQRIMDYLRSYGSITQKEAMDDLGIMRLGARIYDLKREGVNIKTEFTTGKNRFGEVVSFARYKLEDMQC